MEPWTLVFDVDDTLYLFESGIFDLVRERITAWLERALRLSRHEAETLRQRYFHTYGTTLAGLRQEHPELDHEDYLVYVHDVPVEAFIHPDPALDAMLSRLAARKVIFTNATWQWAERITRALGVRHHFDLMVDIYAANYISKPYPYPYEVLLRAVATPPQHCIMLDDQPRNLFPAAQLGMRTVLVRPDGEKTAGIDHVVPNIYAAEPWLQEVLRNGVTH